MSDLESSSKEPSLAPSPPIRPGTGLPIIPHRFPGWLPPLFFLLLALSFLWRSLFTGEVFLPAALLGHVAPWKFTSLYPHLPFWNPLRWDGIGQFYPWRKFAAETLRSGYLPLWNPYQFCGTPFVANSQSAVFYPGNIFFLLISDTAYAFGWSAALHLTLAGWFTYLLLRRLRCSETASLLGGVVYAYSAWQTAWLQLPTFLATSCWIPLLLSQTHRIADFQSSLVGFRAANPAASWTDDRRGTDHGLLWLTDTCALGGIVGLMLLAGHLQIALYGLLGGTCFAIGLLVVRRARPVHLAMWGGGLILGLMLAMPQLLPAIELSRISHRAGKPSAEGYRSYTEYALPVANVAALLLPDLFGGDSDPANPYWGFYTKRLAGGQAISVYHNPAETAIYIGILPLLLGVFGLVRGMGRKGIERRTAFFALLAAFALLLALGTPVNLPLYFGIPGFAASGSPARCLVLWALAWSGLAAMGLDRLAERFAAERELAIVYGIVIGLLALALNLVARLLSAPPPGIKILPLFGEVLARIGVDWARLALFLLAGVGLLAWPMFRPLSARTSAASTPAPVLLATLALVILDLLWCGIGTNPSARREQVYPETPGIAYLREHAGHERIFPINQRWSLFAPPPFTLPAVLPPNAATVFGLRDVQGYDSLFSGRFKGYANTFARPNRQGQLDASPAEVGNIVFTQNANAPNVSDIAAAFAIAIPYTEPGFAPEAVPPTTPIDIGDPGMMVYPLTPPGGRARLSPSAPASSLAWIEDLPTRVTLSASAPSPSTLTLLDMNLPGWRVTIDGRPATIAPSANDPVSRAAALPPGKHAIAFRYEPASFRTGLYAACAVLFLATLSATLFLTAHGNRKPV